MEKLTILYNTEWLDGLIARMISNKPEKPRRKRKIKNNIDIRSLIEQGMVYEETVG